MKVDCLILGAGMVGIGAALHLQKLGRSVALADRRGPAEETSYGNAGLIQSEAVMPYAFPRSLSKVIAVALNRTTEAHLHWSALPKIAPWLFGYWRHGSRAAVEATARAMFPLISRALGEHEELMRGAGIEETLRRTGYLLVFRDQQRLQTAIRAQDKVTERFGIPFTVCHRDAIARLEPHLTGDLAGAIHLTGPASVPDPSQTGKAYADLFVRNGGALLTLDAMTLRSSGDGWQVGTGTDIVEAREVVIALGPWSGDLLSRFGVRVPLGVKRGYHMHYGLRGNAVLNRLVVDDENGFVLSPNRRGVRLTTGAEFTLRDAPPSPVQLSGVEPLARAMLPLDERRDDEVWMGSRPCLPDLVPMIGPVPGRRGLWADFGHHHLGFTLGPATGRLLSEMMTGAEPFTDPEPYRVGRFTA